MTPAYTFWRSALALSIKAGRLQHQLPCTPARAFSSVWLERFPYKEEAAGSSPATPTGERPVLYWKNGEINKTLSLRPDPHRGT